MYEECGMFTYLLFWWLYCSRQDTHRERERERKWGWHLAESHGADLNPRPPRQEHNLCTKRIHSAGSAAGALLRYDRPRERRSFTVSLGDTCTWYMNFICLTGEKSPYTTDRTDVYKGERVLIVPRSSNSKALRHRYGCNHSSSQSWSSSSRSSYLRKA